MRSRGAFSALRIISIGLILAAIVLGTLQLVRFSRVRTFLPAGLIIANIAVGGLDRAGAAQRLAEVYSLPIELFYADQLIHLNPSVVDFSLDTEDMLALAGLERTQTQFWQEFWDYLWGRSTFPSQIPLSASYSEARLRVFLGEIAERYDQPAEPALPIPGSVNFTPGTAGTALEQNSAVLLIESALFSLSNRTINLPLRRVEPNRPTFQNIEVLLKQTLQISEFDGLAGVYLLDLQSAQEIHFAVLDGEEVSVQPDIAFTASSIIKVPIMVATFRRIQGSSDSETLKLLEDMVDRSGNEAADWLMDRVIDPTHTRGPLVVSEDMQTLGLESTFLAG